MPAFDFRAAGSLDEALALLERFGDEAEPMAGGTSMVLMHKQGLIRPAIVVGVREIAELHGIRATAGGGIEIGAATTHRAIETSPLVHAFAPELARTFGRIATPRIRNQATIGGNLVHADPAQDPPPMLLALDAEVTIASTSGSRSLPLDAFFVDFFETSLREGELLQAVRIPPVQYGARLAYTKYLPGSQDDYATVAIAALLLLDDDGRCAEVRIGLGALGLTPLRARRVEEALRGNHLTRNVIADAAALVREEIDPLDDVRGSAAYKREMARVWTARTLESLAREQGAIA